MQSVLEESLPPPSVGAIRGKMMPSGWILQPVQRGGQELTRVIYLLQVRYFFHLQVHTLSDASQTQQSFTFLNLQIQINNLQVSGFFFCIHDLVKMKV